MGYGVRVGVGVTTVTEPGTTAEPLTAEGTRVGVATAADPATAEPATAEPPTTAEAARVGDATAAEPAGADAAPTVAARVGAATVAVGAASSPHAVAATAIIAASAITPRRRRGWRCGRVNEIGAMELYMCVHPFAKDETTIRAPTPGTGEARRTPRAAGWPVV